MRVGGTNCDSETQRAFQELGVKAEILHLNQLVKRKNLLDYQVLVFPGGFSFGDYVRAGAILARSLSARLGKELRKFVEENRPILGICNGFQVLVEYGLLPGFEEMGGYDDIPYLEDVEFCNKAKRYGKMKQINRIIYTSQRRFISHGKIKITIIFIIAVLLNIIGIRPKGLNKYIVTK